MTITRQVSHKNTPDVLIAGAGPTGLMLALWLVRLGITIRIVDPKPGPTTETRAIAVQARTLEYYDQLGIGEAALERGMHFGRVNAWTRGYYVGAFKIEGVAQDATPHPYMYILTQDQNEALLVERLASLGVHVEWGTRLASFTQDDASVSAQLERSDEVTRVQTAYLVGCDGGSSTVRQGLGVAFSGGTYEHRFFVADVTARGKIKENDVNMSLDNNTFLAFFPMPDPDRHRVIGQMPDDAEDFGSIRPVIEANGLARVEAVHWFSTYRSHHRVAHRFRVGRVFLLGDAGHLHSPVGGQGMNTGLGDAANLGWKLAQVVRGGPAALLETYEAERRPFAVSLVHTTDRVFSAILQASPLARLARTRLLPLILGLMRSRVARRQLFLRVSQTRIHYRNSPLSVGQAGRVRAGDRLPYVISPKGSNFEALRTLDWQGHVYGAADSALRTWCEQRNLKLHMFPYSSQARRAGLAEHALYLIRPDGHVGLAQTSFEAEALEHYAATWLTPRSLEPEAQSVQEVAL